MLSIRRNFNNEGIAVFAIVQIENIKIQPTENISFDLKVDNGQHKSQRQEEKRKEGMLNVRSLVNTSPK